MGDQAIDSWKIISLRSGHSATGKNPESMQQSAKRHTIRKWIEFRVQDNSVKFKFEEVKRLPEDLL